MFCQIIDWGTPWEILDPPLGIIIKEKNVSTRSIKTYGKYAVNEGFPSSRDEAFFNLIFLSTKDKSSVMATLIAAKLTVL